MATKIETDLSPEQLIEFCRRCGQLKGGTTLRAIQSLAAEFGVSVSLMGATSFRDGPLAGYLAELKAKSERAQQVAAFAQSGLSLSDAAAVRLSETVFDELMAPTANALTAEERDTYSKIIARARAGDQRAKKLEADLRLRDEQIQKLTAERAERESKLQQIAAATQKARNAPAKSADEVRAQVVAEIDRIMGIAPKK